MQERLAEEARLAEIEQKEAERVKQQEIE